MAKTASKDEVIERWAAAQGKLNDQYGIQEFKNANGENAVALVDLKSNSVVAQVNGKDTGEALQKLYDGAVSTRVEGGVAPAEHPMVGREVGPGWGGQDTQTHADNPMGDIKGSEHPDMPNRTVSDMWEEMPRNERGQVVYYSDGNIEGLEQDQAATEGQSGDSQANQEQTSQEQSQSDRNQSGSRGRGRGRSGGRSRSQSNQNQPEGNANTANGAEATPATEGEQATPTEE